MGFFDLFREDPKAAADAEELRRKEQQRLDDINREIADLDRRQATDMFQNPEADAILRQRLEANRDIFRENLRDFASMRRR